MRLAVLGFSSAGRRHALYLRELGHDVAVFDPLVEAVPDELVRAPTMEAAVESSEAVVIATPTSLHAEQAVFALESGRHVLVEKPMATTVDEALPLAEISERAGLVCAVALNMRFHRAIVELRRLLQIGALGQPYYAAASFGHDLRQWRAAKDYRETYSASAALGGGIVLDAVHELDYLVWLLGPAESVSAEVGKISALEIDVEDIAVASIRFRSGAIGSVDLNYLDPAYRRTCLIVGSIGSAFWDWGDAAITVRRAGGPAYRDAGETIDVAFQVEDSYRAEVDDFLEAIENGRTPRASARNGLESLGLADAIKQSAAEGRRRVVR